MLFIDLLCIERSMRVSQSVFTLETSTCGLCKFDLSNISRKCQSFLWNVYVKSHKVLGEVYCLASTFLMLPITFRNISALKNNNNKTRPFNRYFLRYKKNSKKKVNLPGLTFPNRIFRSVLLNIVSSFIE